MIVVHLKCHPNQFDENRQCYVAFLGICLLIICPMKWSMARDFLDLFSSPRVVFEITSGMTLSSCLASLVSYIWRSCFLILCAPSTDGSSARKYVCSTHNALAFYGYSDAGKSKCLVLATPHQCFLLRTVQPWRLQRTASLALSQYTGSKCYNSPGQRD